jgi:hypothetical protein
MPIDQNLLLHAALQYQEHKNQQYIPGGRLVSCNIKKLEQGIAT